ncbi:hypothetical protein [Actinocrispum wychmicini]|uniref:Uncharacterized protein n=1 Tax=Actinocrispum wychmicini TaxID=1213861 RepID=A0A4R2J1Y7_9PSEU|nr:hypothetical protein [Actinocrispum wychmicini]TCO50818.1 hypothetical protein EV192_113199 [Actinocrispum wychmicini]
MSWLSEWWNAVELWITQLAFPAQFAVVIAVLLPVCAGGAWLIDRAVDYVGDKINRARGPSVEDCD